MNNIIHSIQTQGKASVNVKSTVSGGSSVFVRVLEDKGSSSYVVSFAGQKVLVKSEKSLVPGQSFRARIELSQDKKILLIPQTEENNIKSALNSLSLIEADKNPQGLIEAFFNSQNLVSDSITLTIFQFLQQSGFKTDKSLMEKARRIALNFTGKEKKAAEIAVLLLENGLESDAELMQKIMALLDCDKNENQHKEKKESFDEENQKIIPPDKNILEKIYDSTFEDADLLALVNQNAKVNPHYIFFPYDYTFLSKKAHGLISFLIDSKTKQIQKMSLNCKFDSTEYYFVLYYKGSFPSELVFFQNGLKNESPLKCENFLKEILVQEDSLKNIQIKYSDEAYTQGFFVNNKILPLIVGETFV